MTDSELGESATPQYFNYLMLLRGLLTLSVVVAVIFIVGEFLLRIVDFSELPISESTGTPLNGGNAVQLDAKLGWMQIPNIETQAVTGNRTVSVRHNSLGLREKELNGDAPNGTIIFLGDSMVWGLDAETNERFTDLMQQVLPQNRMVNAGVLGFGTDQELMLVQQLWSKVQPKIVVLTFSNDNDHDDNSSSFRYRTNYKPYIIQTPEHTWQIRGYPIPRLRRSYVTGNIWVENFALARLAVLTYLDISNYETIVPDPTESLVGMMQRTAQARGAHLVVGLQRHDIKLEAYLQSQGIPHTTFEDAQRYPTAGGHWTPQGNQLVAKRYLALLTEAGILTSLAGSARELAVLERNGRLLSEIDDTLKRGNVSAQQTAKYSDTLVSIRDALHAIVSEISTSDDRALQQARALAKRADLISDYLSVLRDKHFGQRLFEPTSSILSPFVWLDAARALPGEVEKLIELFRFWGSAVRDSGGLWRGTAALLVLTVLHTILGYLWLWWRQRITPATGVLVVASKAFSSFRAFVRVALTSPLAIIIVGEALEVRIFEISIGVYAGIIIAAFGQAVAVGVIAPNDSSRRLMAIGDATALKFARYINWSTLALGWLMILLAAHRAVAASVELFIATKMIFALIIAGMGLCLLWSSRNSSSLPPRVRLVAWIVLTSIAVALIAGFGNFAAFVAEQMVSAVAVLGAGYLLLALAKALFVSHCAADAPRLLAANFGVSPRWLGLAAGLTLANMCLVLVLALLVLCVAPWYITGRANL